MLRSHGMDPYRSGSKSSNRDIESLNTEEMDAGGKKATGRAILGTCPPAATESVCVIISPWTLISKGLCSYCLFGRQEGEGVGRILFIMDSSVLRF